MESSLPRVYTAASYALWWKPISLSVSSSLAFQARGACRSPYSAFQRRSTLFSLPAMTWPGGCRTYTSSFKSPLRNADFTSMWWTHHPF
ncbi:hypothetical protein PAHAL_3G458700 [Panicum hallii]|uniref:Uncharacterized protein n=1 Tax=Panicum hallii TaxID=206008 RepID=A0A2T8KLH2_9POAL|nr:hypothetical protein PAHAL_3G458700 [Panicum hallii]